MAALLGSDWAAPADADAARRAARRGFSLKTRTQDQTRTNTVDKTTLPAAPAPAEQVQPRQLERSVSWTGAERLRCLWYRLRLTIAEMNYATRRLAELQSRPPR
ncbi:MAG TPA: hypothetical protein VII59_19100 [Streptosporangiaceae bacterium]